MDDTQMLTVGEAATLLGLSRSRVRAAVREGLLTGTREPRRVTVDAASVERYRTEHLRLVGARRTPSKVTLARAMAHGLVGSERDIERLSDASRARD